MCIASKLEMRQGAVSLASDHIRLIKITKKISDYL